MRNDEGRGRCALPALVVPIPHSAFRIGGMMPVDVARMQARLAALTTPELGGTPGGGMSRLALSDADRAARDLFVGWLRELRLAVRVDDFGNVYGRRAGAEPD